MAAILITLFRVLITLLITTHEPPSKFFLGQQVNCKLIGFSRLTFFSSLVIGEGWVSVTAKKP